MKALLRMLGWLLLIVTIGIASCQTLLKAEETSSLPISAVPPGDAVLAGR